MNLTTEIINEWKLGSLPQEKKTEVINRIGLLLLQALMVRSLDILSQEEQAELDDLMNENTTTTEDILRFLKAKIPTFNTLVKEERESLKREILI